MAHSFHLDVADDATATPAHPTQSQGSGVPYWVACAGNLELKTWHLEVLRPIPSHTVGNYTCHTAAHWDLKLPVLPLDTFPSCTS